MQLNVVAREAVGLGSILGFVSVATVNNLNLMLLGNNKPITATLMHHGIEFMQYQQYFFDPRVVTLSVATFTPPCAQCEKGDSTNVEVNDIALTERLKSH